VSEVKEDLFNEEECQATLQVMAVEY